MSYMPGTEEGQCPRCGHDEFHHEDEVGHVCLVCLGFVDEGTDQLTPEGWARIRASLAVEEQGTP